MAKKGRGKSRDKIFGNDYNTGELEYQHFTDIKIKDGFNPNEYTDESHVSWETHEIEKLLFEIFQEAEFYEKYRKIKKVPKSEMYDIYYFFDENLPENKYSSIQRFTGIADFMKMRYKTMFNLLSPLDKQKIIKELDDEYDVLGKRNIKRLF